MDCSHKQLWTHCVILSADKVECFVLVAKEQQHSENTLVFEAVTDSSMFEEAHDFGLRDVGLTLSHFLN